MYNRMLLPGIVIQFKYDSTYTSDSANVIENLFNQIYK